MEKIHIHILFLKYRWREREREREGEMLNKVHLIAAVDFIILRQNDFVLKA
jgi:hypothetical protein